MGKTLTVSDSWSRRDFLRSAAGGIAAGGAGAVIPHPMRPLQPLPARSRWAAKPVAIASANGLRGVQKAFDMLMQGADTLDAVIEGVKIQELDPNDTTVGYGGLPNRDGVVQLDASCMHGPTKRAGAVGCLENIKTPSAVAKLVLKYTNHIFLVGEGAKKFALSYGFKGSAVTPGGDLSSVTTTAGLAFKIPGRVGDSAVVGAGQYCDNEVGAAGSTGRGESNIKVCGGFLTVDNMRRGMKPTDACLESLKRVIATTEPRLLDARGGGHPKFGLIFYAVNKRGEFGAASLYPGRYAAHDGTDAKLHDTAHVFEQT